MAERRVVVGGTIAALVAADALGAAGTPTRLLAPANGLGRGFTSIPDGERRLSLGVRLLELSYEDDPAPPPLSAYAPGLDGHRPYARTIRRWTEQLLGEHLREIAPPRVVVDGRLVDDYLFTVDLLPLATAAAPAERERIAAEAEAATARGGSAGVLSTELGETTLATASLANHGQTFHDRFIEPLARKFVARGSSSILAAWRRKAWLPLFWPETVAEAFSTGSVRFRPRRTFHEVAPGGVGGFVDALVARVRSHASVEFVQVGKLTAIESRPRAVTLRFDDGHAERAARPAVGVPPAELYAAAAVPFELARMRTVLAWIEGDRETLAPGVDLAHVLDPGNPVVRFSGGSTTPAPGRRIVCVELRHDLPQQDAAAAAIAGLREAGVLTGEAEAVRASAAQMLPVPDGATRAQMTAAAVAFAARGHDLRLLGAAVAPGADSLNEQIVQGLQAAEELR
ncbi:hypothetical protein [Conexibacter sp. CPCC 206217]|uniref:hypothetical protein n=1 Tax=Conexibacter sp. CPCC 206217 TaxID=3064574 RepID=UPI00271E9093|nr:hypothetical protein [Conexibacter sp. CPCC 206217]MDO8211377.1 hypothetical protein [Conexibacter sp. CPCC 206217]